jgi:hypothetical protein
MIHLSPTQRQVVNLLRWKDASASIEHGVLNGEPYFKVTTVKGTASNSLEFKLGKIYVNNVEFTGGSGATTFAALTDTPSSYTAGKWLKVNALGTAIEQVDAPTPTSEGASAALAFTNPMGHIRTAALTGNQTFTTSGTALGATVVQPFTSTGTNTLTFSFTHKVINNSLLSGGVLPSGEYELYFSNRGSYVAISVGAVQSQTSTQLNAPTNLTASPVSQTQINLSWTDTNA